MTQLRGCSRGLTATDRHRGRLAGVVPVELDGVDVERAVQRVHHWVC